MIVDKPQIPTNIPLYDRFYELAQTDRNSQVKSCLKVVLESWDDKFLIYILGFQKSNIGCPQQPLTEKVLKSVKNWIFDDPFHKNGPGLVI